jgi:lysophospholipase L1-like esterase
MKKMKIVLIASLITNLLLISGATFVLYKKGGINFIKLQIKTLSSTSEYPSYYLQKKGIFESLTATNVEKVFVGDSITDHGEFQEYFPKSVVLNRGISNDKAGGVLNRIEEVVNRKPKEVYIMIGINDIISGTDLPVFETSMRNIVDSFNASETKVFVQSILPVNNDLYGNAVSNTKVLEFDAVIKDIALETGANYIDLYTSFADDENQLNREYTIDGIHLNEKGYKVWMDIISQ